VSIDQNTDAVSQNLSNRRTGGLYDLPVVGTAVGAVRDFYDGMAPTEADNFGMTVAKEVFRHGSVIVVAAGAAVVML